MIAILCTTYDVGVDRYTPNKKADNKAKCRLHCMYDNEI